MLAASDRMALGAQYALEERGFSIPQNFAIVGFDDIDLAKSSYPTLT
ncbi:MAG: substrate-binding domain-containing protein, partial [Anaerolineales bacterium]